MTDYKPERSIKMDEEKLLTDEDLDNVSGGRLHLGPNGAKKLTSGLAVATKLAGSIASGGLGGVLADTIGSGDLGSKLGNLVKKDGDTNL